MLYAHRSGKRARRRLIYDCLDVLDEVICTLLYCTLQCYYYGWGPGASGEEAREGIGKGVAGKGRQRFSKPISEHRSKR